MKVDPQVLGHPIVLLIGVVAQRQWAEMFPQTGNQRIKELLRESNVDICLEVDVAVVIDIP